MKMVDLSIVMSTFTRGYLILMAIFMVIFPEETASHGCRKVTETIIELAFWLNTCCHRVVDIVEANISGMSWNFPCDVMD